MVPENSPLLGISPFSGAVSYHYHCCTHGTAVKFLHYYAGMRVPKKNIVGLT